MLDHEPGPDGHLRALTLAAVLLLGNPMAGSPVDRCVCTTTRATNGWCQVHGFGYVGGLRIDSAWLYEALDAHGHELDLSTFACPACKRAIAADGYCEAHRVGFVRRQAYFSRLTYELAGAEPVTGDARCSACRTNALTHGWCEKDRVGMVGPFAFRSRADFDQAARALALVEVAAKASARCDHCAGAILTDGECPFCRIRYKDGKPAGN